MMRDTRIKICGVTTVEDAQSCAALGVDYIGLIFADSARQVKPERAAKIRDAVPDAMLVGVFMDAPIDVVVRAARGARINLVQLHGAESPEYCDTLLRKLGLPIIKSFSGARVANNSLGRFERTSYFHLDLDKNLPRNGNGMVSPYQESLWQEASKLRGKGYRIFLAGGLGEANVRRALREVQPYCIDVAGSVESAPGIKDYERMRRFVMEVRR